VEHDLYDIQQTAAILVGEQNAFFPRFESQWLLFLSFLFFYAGNFSRADFIRMGSTSSSLKFGRLLYILPMCDCIRTGLDQSGDESPHSKIPGYGIRDRANSL
jgi:hypothetical protein